MSNPAELLLEIVDGWEPKGSNRNLLNVRRLSVRLKDDEPSPWDTHRRAVGHLLAIETIIDAMEASEVPITLYRSALRRWTRFVFAIESSWGTEQDADLVMHEADRDLLEALSDLIADTFVPVFSDEQRESVLASIGEAVAALAEDDLPPELKRHLLDVIGHARQCVEEYETLGDFELAVAIQRLQATVTAAAAYTAAENSDSRAAKTWAAIRDGLNGPFVVATVGNLLAQGSVQLLLGG
jgi:hypothetical protein